MVTTCGTRAILAAATLMAPLRAEFDKNDVRIGVAQDRAEFPHAAILVPNGKLRWQRTGLSAEVPQNTEVIVRKFGREGGDAVAPIHHVENEGVAGIDKSARR